MPTHTRSNATALPRRPPRTKAAEKERIAAILQGLATAYPEAHCALHHRSVWELLVATILSAQCTDVRVNMVTPGLFQKYPTVKDFAAVRPEVLAEDIRSTGFFNNKAKSVTGAARALIERFHGQVPDTMEELLTLPGVARKTANVVLGVWFRKATGVVVDTHVARISKRLGMTQSEDPKRIEEDLVRILPQDQWIDFSHRVIAHGRAICVARKPKCIDCSIEKFCFSKDKTWWSEG